jgi:hypothetical protein
MERELTGLVLPNVKLTEKVRFLRQRKDISYQPWIRILELIQGIIKGPYRSDTEVRWTDELILDSAV